MAMACRHCNDVFLGQTNTIILLYRTQLRIGDIDQPHEEFVIDVFVWEKIGYLCDALDVDLCL